MVRVPAPEEEDRRRFSRERNDNLGAKETRPGPEAAQGPTIGKDRNGLGNDYEAAWVAKHVYSTKLSFGPANSRSKSRMDENGQEVVASLTRCYRVCSLIT
ncbi:hypothetical protein FHX09_001279 [Rhizobium sp. BK538]|nr:hypothetical protein [Rhizobium sp. BK538]